MLTIFGCKSQDRELPPDVKTTAYYKTHSSIIATNKLIPDVKIRAGEATVFDYVRDKADDREIINGDTVVTADTDFFERVTFEINSAVDTFYYKDDSLELVNGFYEFHGGEAPLANTDFKVRKGFIKGHKQDGDWIIEASIGVVDRQKTDSNIQEIKFNQTFKNCN
jgi:hypothetical protein